VKQYRFYIVTIGIVIAILVFIESLAPTPVNWSPSFSSRDKIPYGNHILFDLLSDLFREQEIVTIRQPAYNQLAGRHYDSINYIFINLEFAPGELDLQKLLEFVSHGNYVFIAADRISGALQDSLGVRTATPFNLGRDSSSINFVNPSLETPKGYDYREGAKAYFSDFDTARTTLLGINDRGEPDYIRVDYGHGSFYLNTVPLAFTNYNMLHGNNAEYVMKALSYLPVRQVLWDEYYKVGRQGAKTPLRYILGTEALQWAYYLLIASVILYIIFEGKRRQRIIPEIKPLANTTLEFADTVGKLYYQHGDHRNIADKKITYLLEYIRSNFHEKTGDFNESFYERISEKSGIALDRIRALFEYIRSVSGKALLTEHELTSLNSMIEEFFSTTKR
jgi:hypothetical protein